MRKGKFSSTIIKLFVLLFIPLTILICIYTVYTSHILSERTETANRHTLDLYAEKIHQDIVGVCTFINSITASGKEFQLLQIDLEPVEIQAYERQLLDKYKGILQTNTTVSGLFVFNPDKNCYGSAFSSNVEERTQIELICYFKEAVGTLPVSLSDSMYVKEIGGQYYLIYLKSERGVSCASVVSFANITQSRLTGKGKYIFYEGDKQEIFHTNLSPEESGFVFGESMSPLLKISEGDFRGVRKPLGILDINILYLVEEEAHMMLDMTQSLLLCMTFLALLLIPFVYIFIRNTFFAPMESMMGTINRIKKGNMELRMEKNQSIDEFFQISDSFNGMLDEIQQYKIESYEKELAIQNARLQYYQLQMRPHFFINCLKNIYALAEQKEYGNIQNMVLAFSVYWRHVMQDSLHLISLRRELESVESYISLMEMTVELPPRVVFDVAEDIKEYPVPPLVILTFVENAIKHITFSEKEVQIHIKGLLINTEKPYLNLSVTDNGEGFSDENLRELNGAEEENVYQGEKIGIVNVKHRLQILYQGEGMISFSNSIQGGHVEIFIPVSDKGEM